ncbi:XRE family transcriptional regulator [Pseudomonas tructae]|uniref:XRE family transcriptional regulator n=1 Tax=Pseudomonas tructae TaxID=2518644 RepID=A0A411MK65_9PSED|nr:XRE family transcriptional regulator [Pseudomonas tructae]QBF27180.1 XRE family transcriptional regulator [Pseudomonas tructae]
MDIGKEIRIARKAKGLTLEALANQVDTDTGNLSRLERGKQGASQELLKRIMDVLDLRISTINPSEGSAVGSLLGGAVGFMVPAIGGIVGALIDKANSTPGVKQPKIATPRPYPVLEWSLIYKWFSDPSSIDLDDIDDWLLTVQPAGDYAFWVKVKGDAMASYTAPSFPSGSMILVRPIEAAKSGSFCLVKLPDSDEITFKQYVEDAGVRYLRSLNAGYRSIEIDDRYKIIGIVIDTKMTGL